MPERTASGVVGKAGKQQKAPPDHILLVAGEGGETVKAIALLSEAGYLPLLAADLERGLDLCASEGPRVVLLHLGLPDLTDAQVRDFAAQCRQEGQASVLGLVPEDKSAQVNFALDLEDFLLLPLRRQELLLRVKHALWRKRGAHGGKDTLQFGDLVIDTERYEVLVGDHRVDLTYKEYELLKHLATHPGRVFTREELLSKVWGYDYFGGTRTVDVHIRRLRSKLEDATHSYLDTVRNVGYGFKSRDEITR